jgi:hypothetical protein
MMAASCTGQPETENTVPNGGFSNKPETAISVAEPALARHIKNQTLRVKPDTEMDMTKRSDVNVKSDLIVACPQKKPV